MKLTEALRVAFAFTVLVVLHFSLRPLLGWRASPDFLIIALLLLTIRVRPGTAAVVGLLMGLVADSLSPESFGASSLAMCLVGFAASWLKAVFFADDLALNAFFFFLGKWAFDIVFLLAEHRTGGGELLLQMLVWSPLSAAVTSLAGLAMLLVLRPILKPAAT
jgi:rod shape-determining protein MreD